MTSVPGTAGLSDALLSVAAEAGITRLAELTGLDSIGIPVWQAVRPASRALSIHQGKGLTDAVARRGAIMEAIESHHAETWRPGDVSRPTPDTIAVEPLGASPGFAVPVAAAGLDCTLPLPAGVDVNSDGLAAHFDLEAATLTALLERVERAAVARWQRAPAVVRSGTALSGIACPIIADMRERCARRGVGVRFYGPGAVVPVVVAELRADGHQHADHQRVWGAAAAFDWPAAAGAALLEALQTRCSQIAGARDTIPLRHAGRGIANAGRGIANAGRGIANAGRGIANARGFGLPGSWAGHSPPLLAADAPRDLAGLLGALAATGCPQVGRIIVSPPSSLAVTVRVFVPGLMAA